MAAEELRKYECEIKQFSITAEFSVDKFELRTTEFEQILPIIHGKPKFSMNTAIRCLSMWDGVIWIKDRKKQHQFFIDFDDFFGLREATKEVMSRRKSFLDFKYDSASGGVEIQNIAARKYSFSFYQEEHKILLRLDEVCSNELQEFCKTFLRTVFEYTLSDIFEFGRS